MSMIVLIHPEIQPFSSTLLRIGSTLLQVILLQILAKKLVFSDDEATVNFVFSNISLIYILRRQNGTVHQINDDYCEIHVPI